MRTVALKAAEDNTPALKEQPQDMALDTVDPAREDIDWDKESPGFKDYVMLVRQAIDRNDPNLCAQAKAYIYKPPQERPAFHSSREESINTCLASYGRANKDPDICLRMNPYRVPPKRRLLIQQLKDACLYETQLKRGVFKKRWCQQIHNKRGWFFKRCVEKLYAQTSDAAICFSFFENDPEGLKSCQLWLHQQRNDDTTDQPADAAPPTE